MEINGIRVKSQNGENKLAKIEDLNENGGKNSKNCCHLMTRGRRKKFNVAKNYNKKPFGIFHLQIKC